MTYVQVAGFMQQQENIIIINYIISLMSFLLFKCVRITFHLWIFIVNVFFFSFFFYSSFIVCSGVFSVDNFNSLHFLDM